MYLANGIKLHNRYIIQAVLGHGGFGITYAAHDELLNVKVAIKEYLPRQMATRGEGQTKVSVFSGEARHHFDYGLRKFLEEAQAVARFSHHPNIVSARDFFEANGTAYLVMEYVEGVTLKEYLERKGGKISSEEATAIMLPVIDALREVHQVGLLHRDISPDNIYLSTSGQIKVLDFGAARYFAGEQSKSLSIILKAGYAPEEQYRSKGNQGPWTDVYACAATFYRAITGQTPPEALDRLAEDTLVPPSRLGVALPPAVEQGLLQGLAVRAEQRLPDMVALRQALTGMGGETRAYQTVGWSPPSDSAQVGVSPIDKAPAHPPLRRRRSGAAPYVILAILIFGGAGLYAWQASRTNPNATPPSAENAAAQTRLEPKPPTNQPSVPFPETAPLQSPPTSQIHLAPLQPGSKWLLEWQSLFKYRGFLYIKRQIAVDRYDGRISLKFFTKSGPRIVSMDALVVDQGKEILIRCSNADDPSWDTDDFFLERHNGIMTGYNIDKKGRRGQAKFTLVDESRFAAFFREEFQLQETGLPPASQTEGSDRRRIQQLIQEYYNSVAQKNVDGALSLYASYRIPQIKRHILAAIARDTEYYRFIAIDITQLDNYKATAHVQLFHKKYNQREEKWLIEIRLVKENGDWRIVATPGNRVY